MKRYILFYLGSLLVGSTLNAQEKKQTQAQKDSIQQLNEITVNGSKQKFRREKSATVSKMPLADIENPQVYNTVTAELLKEQVVTNFNDALKNATGVSRLWQSTGRGGDGAEFYSMRGFAVQPTMINGLPGINNGSFDPSNIDNIEVIKGPSGTLFGSSLISYGGLINIVTKKPTQNFGGELSYNSGTYGLERITADVNIPLTVEKDALLRINTAYQKENSFQDAGFNRSFFFAPTLSYTVTDRLSFLITTEFTNRNSANAPMIFLNRYAPLSFTSIDLFEKNYKKSFTSNDLTISNPAFSMQAQMFYKLSDAWTSQTVLSRSNAKTDGYYAYLWDSSNGDAFGRFISKVNGETLTTDIQQNFIGDFKIGNLRNRIVAGLDYFHSNITDGSTGWVANGTVTLSDSKDTGDLTRAGVDNVLAGTFAGNSSAKNEVYSAYASNVLNITPKLSVMASLRVDHFKSATSAEGDAEISGQTALSPKFGLVYQPIENKVSVFANYMNGFKNIAPSKIYSDDAVPQYLGMQAFDPEHANQYEFGIKTNLLQDKILITASYYAIDVTDKIMASPTNPNNSVQGGAVESKGIEVSVIANPIEGLSIITGFSNNKSKVTKETPGAGYLGFRPEEAGPENVFNFWANYTLSEGQMKGLSFGAGTNYASKNKTLNRDVIGTFILPSYSILNAVMGYKINKFNISLKLNNVLNEKYYTGWSTVSPQNLRSIAAGLTYRI